MSGEKVTEVFKVTAKPLDSLIHGQHYQGWLCSECEKPVVVLDDPEGTGPTGGLGPEEGHVRLKCPHCGEDRLYGLNDRVRIVHGD